MRTLEELNAEINEKDYPVFPFINFSNRITKLNKGLYKKHKANFRGITCVNIPVGEGVFNEEVRLNGYYDIPFNMLIVPDNIVMTTEKENFKNYWISKGYKVVNNLPSIRPKTYEEGSDEYEAATKARKDYIEHKKKDKYLRDKMDSYKNYFSNQD